MDRPYRLHEAYSKLHKALPCVFVGEASKETGSNFLFTFMAVFSFFFQIYSHRLRSPPLIYFLSHLTNFTQLPTSFTGLFLQNLQSLNFHCGEDRVFRENRYFF